MAHFRRLQGTPGVFPRAPRRRPGGVHEQAARRAAAPCYQLRRGPAERHRSAVPLDTVQHQQRCDQQLNAPVGLFRIPACEPAPSPPPPTARRARVANVRPALSVG